MADVRIDVQHDRDFGTRSDIYVVSATRAFPDHDLNAAPRWISDVRDALEGQTELRDRVQKVRQIAETQRLSGNWNYNAYMHGMANGLILALAILDDCEPQFLKAPEEWLADRPITATAGPIEATESAA